jgi:hypothetical protein
MADNAWMQLLPQAPAPVALQTPQQTLSLQQMQMHLDALRRQNATQNQLQNLFSNPDAIDKNTGLPTANALRDIYRIDPQTGLDVSNSVMRGAAFQSQQNYRQSEQAGKLYDRLREIDTNAYSVEQQAASEGKPPDQARAAAQAYKTQQIDALRSAGFIPPGLNISPAYNSTAAGAAAISPEKRESGWDRLTDYPPDGGAPVVYEHNKYTQQNRTLTGGSYTPSGFAEPKKGDRPDIWQVTVPDGKGGTTQKYAQVGSNGGFTDNDTGQRLSGVTNPHKLGTVNAASQEAIDSTAEAVARYEIAPPSLSRANGPEIIKKARELNPNFDAKNYQSAQRLMSGYANTTPNSPGGRLNSINTAVQHMDVLQNAADALANKDIRGLNYVLNYAQTQLGHPEVTSYNAAAQIVSDEVLKAVIGSGAVFDRAKLLDQLTNAGSPEQIRQGIKTLKDLMGGQANSLLTQWRSFDLPEDRWTQKLTPEAEEAISPYLKNRAAAQEQLPAEARAKLQEGKITGFQNGQRWTLCNGKPVQVQ